jgi:glycolate oxidase FAD binding subunit
LSPTTEDELAEALRATATSGEITRLGGAFSKDHLGGVVSNPKRTITASSMNRVLKYEPRDLTISVEAGLQWTELSRILAGNKQMIPLDPPYFERATVGGVIATNSCGPRRRLYGSARDLVIGMRFATLEGKVIQTGGMVVKNVAGLDMAKLLIGSFGTLAAIAVVNFKLAPIPPESQTFVLAFDNATACVAARDRVLKSVLQPAAMDVLNPAASALVGLAGYALLLQVGGNTAMMSRYQQELGVTGTPDFDWTAIREFTPRYIAANAQACVARVSSKLTQLSEVLSVTETPIVSRAGNGVSYVHFPTPDRATLPQEWRYVFEYGVTRDSTVFASDFAMMGKVKDLFDPRHILNPGRLYGRI